MKSFIIAALIGVAAMASVAQAEPGGTYGRSKIYDIGNPGYQAEVMDCMNMPCCKGMKAEDMKDCANIPCCKKMQEQGACKKMLKTNKK
jgi:hypothetical protein